MRSFTPKLKQLLRDAGCSENLSKTHEVQLVNYLNGLEKEIGLLINFGPTGIEVKRKYRKPEGSN